MEDIGREGWLGDEQYLLFLSIKFVGRSRQIAYARKQMVPTVGFELTTYRLQGGCSTPELCGHITADEMGCRPDGAVERNRTSDLLITNQLLYQLSYNSMAMPIQPNIIA
jgi:hypothetical protein